MKNPNIRRRLLELALVVLGNLIYAVTVVLFILPARLMSCGTTGIALVLEHLWNIPISGFVLAFNILMLLLGWLVLGRAFAMTTVLSSLLYPVLLEVCRQVLGDSGITENMLLNTVFGGLGLGLAMGIVMRAGASTGGMDIPPLILKKLFSIPVSASLWAFDFCILLAQLSFHTPEDLLYGMALIIVISVTLNKVMLLGTSRTEIKVVSAKAEEIRGAILQQMDRGVTMLDGEGGYARQPLQMIMSVVSNRELPRLEQIIHGIDPESFMVVSRVSEVRGRGFTLSKHYPN